MEPKADPLVIELDGEAERPMCHFELTPSTYRQKKPDIDSSFNIIEFVSLGMKVKNTKIMSSTPLPEVMNSNGRRKRKINSLQPLTTNTSLFSSV